MKYPCFPHQKLLKADLHVAAVKATMPRLILLDILKHTKKPITVRDILTAVPKGTIDEATIYRNMDILEKAGFVHQIRLKDRPSYYEIAHQKHHHHLSCTSCDKIIDIDLCQIEEQTRKIARKNGFDHVSGHSLEFFGICIDCAA